MMDKVMYATIELWTLCVFLAAMRHNIRSGNIHEQVVQKLSHMVRCIS